MPKRGRQIDLEGRIAELLKARATHIAAIEKIDGTLKGVTSLLGGGVSLPAVKEVGTASTGGKRRRRGRFELSGEASILKFIEKAGTPTTKEVNAHWKNEGRGGSADNALTKLVAGKQLKRIALEGQRGSRYKIA